MNEVTVVGGGIGGLVASISCAEANVPVTLFEARSQLGGRARSTRGDFVANHGPHVLYDDGPMWRWLSDRGLAEPAAKAPKTGITFRYKGRVRRTPPPQLARVIPLVLSQGAPSDVSGREWLSARTNPATAEIATRLCHAITFHHDPGSLSAEFLSDRARRAFSVPPGSRYFPGGWATLVARLQGYAESLGVKFMTGTKVTEVPDPPVIIALDLRGARSLLADDSLVWHGARTALLDIGVESRRGDPFLLFDLDDGVFFERYTKPDPSLTPSGTQLIQAQVGLTDAETIGDGVERIERVFDDALPSWRLREVWRRSLLVQDASGAVDLPGTTWRDRPAIDRGNGIYLVGDMAAAPGLLSEVSWASAVEAARLVAATRSGATTYAPLVNSADSTVA